MIIAFVVAMDRNRLIGSRNGLPWHLPADLAHFKRVTLGKPIIMGRRTHESIGRALPGRQNIVVSRNPAYRAAGCDVVDSFDAALEAADAAAEVMVIGGAELFALTLERAGRIYLTVIEHDFEGDTWLPEWDPTDWVEVSREAHAPDDRNPYPYRFVQLERRRD
ncbi:dihydrofolate reductase [Thiohalobacter sp. COW1]|uniref:type 3 dihydrofolate reductase n=1 Tax=Thiohalobacter sp. COW1 TaxID=2795687 RepID=UPI001936D11F|nr:type 3 dihydrofolate reductase [Thiohalobacter sp. COW1]BCO32800.1 dihydrofolate reductase [Thiohalobacter sp. COW1]